MDEQWAQFYLKQSDNSKLFSFDTLDDLAQFEVKFKPLSLLTKKIRSLQG